VQETSRRSTSTWESAHDLAVQVQTELREAHAFRLQTEWAIRTESYRTVHSPRDSVRLALENSERGGDSARKCSVRFGTARGCTVRGAQSVSDQLARLARWELGHGPRSLAHDALLNCLGETELNTAH